MYLSAVYGNVSDSGGYLAVNNACNSSLNAFKQSLGIGYTRGYYRQRTIALHKALAVHNVNSGIGIYLRRLLCGKDYILVVGKHDNVLRLAELECLHELLDRGIRGLSPRHDNISPHALKESGKSLPRCHSDHGKLLVALGLLYGALGMPHGHILYLNGQEFSELLHTSHYHSRIKGVNVDLHDIVLLIGNDALAPHFRKDIEDSVDLKGIGIHLCVHKAKEELRAVAELENAVSCEAVDIYLCAVLTCSSIVSQLLARQRLIHTLCDAEISCRTRVNNVCLSKSGKNILGRLQRAASLFYMEREKFLDGGLCRDLFCGIFCAFTEHGEDSTLRGVLNGGIGTGNASSEGFGKLRSGNGAIALQTLVYTCEYLREYNSRISPCPKQNASCKAA